jgi:hypothetical protein
MPPVAPVTSAIWPWRRGLDEGSAIVLPESEYVGSFDTEWVFPGFDYQRGAAVFRSEWSGVVCVLYDAMLLQGKEGLAAV